MHRNLFKSLCFIIVSLFLCANIYASDGHTCAAKDSTEARNPGEELYQQGFAAYKDSDYTTAVTLLREAADMGHGRAQFYLGYCYYAELGLPHDLQQAAVWFSKSAEQGYAAAQYNLGNLYFNGLGVPEDKEKAVELFRLAAEQGYADAQNNLGFCYHHGLGVEANREEAIKWYNKAVKQGHKLANNNLNSLMQQQ